ncbi:hypothetical protein QQS21_011041 [Conoideocrella luteorostrata]|uniref:Secreted protein n=1 Tax=Conoideocrella luteorostrata TaxID=1105319 RepID=A0AAJ0CDU4_9HYPO|nr:hypothetical protein QQS21_011041 [Conoideocrella luteorostrata]
MLITTPSFVSAAMLVLSSVASVAADKCHVVGYIKDNTVWNPPGGGVIAGSQGMIFYKGDKEIHRWEQCDKCSGVCVDLKMVETPPLKEKFGWAAKCNGGQFKECHGSYGGQPHIDGQKPQNSGDFYGIGYEATSQCRMDFDC